MGNTYLGKAAGWVTSNGLTLWGIILNFCMLILYVVFSLVTKSIPKTVQAKMDEISDELDKSNKEIIDMNDKLTIYSLLITYINNVCKNKIRSISQTIEKTARLTDAITYNYIAQLNNICNSILQYICRTTEIETHQIDVTILFRLNTRSSWNWTDKSSVRANASDDDIDKLIRDECSTFNNILKTDGANCIIYNDKNDASEDGCYVFDSYDKTYSDSGPIACYLSFPIQAKQDRSGFVYIDLWEKIC